MKKVIICLIGVLFLVGCLFPCDSNTVIHSGKVETVYDSSLAVNGKLIEGVCTSSLKDISKGDYVNIYCQNTDWGCSYYASKITTTRQKE